MKRYSVSRCSQTLALTAAAVAAAAAIAACGGSSSSASSSPSGGSSPPASSSSTSGGSSTAASSGASGTLNWAYLQDEPDWDPVVIGATSATQLMSLIYEPLFTLNPQGKVEPALATKYKYNSAGTAITITLRPGLTFQDGSPLDAAAVAFDINRAKTQSNSALKADYEAVKSETVLSKTQLRLNLTQQDYQMPYILANRTSLLASEKAAKTNLNGLNANDPVGAGPYKLVKLTPDSELSVTKWPGYWDAKDIHVQNVNLFLNINPATVLSGLQSGTYNFVSQLPAQDIKLAQKDGFTVVTNAKAAWAADFISLNLNKAPLNNPKVVEAIEDAINRPEFVSQLGFGIATASVQPFPKSSPAYDPALNSEYSYNPTKAKALLAQAGYKPGQIKLPLDVISSLNTGGPELIEQELQAVGIDVTIDAQTVTAFYAGYYGKTDLMTYYGYVGRDSKVEAQNEHFGSDGILNLSAPKEAPQFAAAQKKVLGIPITAPGYEAALQDATKVGVETGSTITVLTQPYPYVIGKSFGTFPLVDGVFRWTGLK
jgi:peptide/nickel transport system substrate-binding protein